MAKLGTIADTDLSEYSLQLLHKHKIFTAHDFLSTQDKILRRIMRTSYEKVELLKKLVLQRYAPKPICLGKSYRSNQNLQMIYQTGIAQLDLLLTEAGEQLISGCIWDICGLVGTGKTELMHTIVANFSSSYDGVVLFLDAHNGFSPVRIKDIIESRQPPGKINSTLAMQSIRVLPVCTSEELLEIMDELVLGVTLADEIWSKLKLVVIDSLPILWFDYTSDEERKTARVQRGILAKYMRQLLAHNGVTFITGNLSLPSEDFIGCTRNSKKFRWDLIQEVLLLDEPSTDFGEPSPKKKSLSDRPMLGTIWTTVPRLRLVMETLPMSEADEEDERHDNSFRQIKILKSCYCATGGSCMVRITDAGVV